MNDQTKIHLCKSKKKKHKHKKKHKTSFAKKNKKALIITAIVLAATACVVIAVVAASSTGAAALAAGAAGAATSSKSDKKKETKPSLEAIDTTAVVAEIDQTPALKEMIEYHISSWNEYALEEIDWQKVEIQQNFTLGEKAREISAFLAHETLDGISEFTAVIPQLGEEIKQLGASRFAESLLPSTPGDLASPRETYDDFVANAHLAIDQLFGAEQAFKYAPDFKMNDPLNIGVLPSPIGGFANVRRISKIQKALQASGETIAMAEELGFSAEEIIQRKHAGTLEKDVARVFDRIYRDEKQLESAAKSKIAGEFLKIYSKKPLPEYRVRELIEQSGIPTFPRPTGIPDNYLVMISGKGAGMIYMHPENSHLSVRIMPGKPHSINPKQRKPYAIQMKNGKAYNEFGELISGSDPEAHIPLEKFVYRE